MYQNLNFISFWNALDLHFEPSLRYPVFVTEWVFNVERLVPFHTVYITLVFEEAQ